jgi:hypothetical protein
VNWPFTPLKGLNIPFSPQAPHDAVWNHTPYSTNNSITHLGITQSTPKMEKTKSHKSLKEKLINSFSIPFTHTAPIKDHPPPFSEVIHCKNFSQSCRSKKETNLIRNFRLPHSFPREYLSKTRMKHFIERVHLKQLA